MCFADVFSIIYSTATVLCSSIPRGKGRSIEKGYYFQLFLSSQVFFLFGADVAAVIHILNYRLCSYDILSVYPLMEFSWKLIQLKTIYLPKILCKHKGFFCKNIYYQFCSLESCFYCLIIVLLNILRLKYGDFVLLTIRYCVCYLITTQDPVEMTFIKKLGYFQLLV